MGKRQTLALAFETLWDIMDKYRVEEIAWTDTRLGWIECWAKRRSDKGEWDLPVPQDFINRHILPTLQQCIELCKSLDLDYTLDRAAVEFQAHIESGQLTVTGLAVDIREIRNDVARKSVES